MPSDYTLVLIDGRRQNAPGGVTPNGFGETSTSFLPPYSAIDRIEVVRGPMSTLYGSDAMGGVVNIITRKAGDHWVGTAPEARRAAITDADVILSAGPAGVSILTAEDLESAPKLLVASDVNAVPPAGIAGIDVNAVDVALPVGKGVGIGALAVGNVKYQTQCRLFRQMLEAQEPLCLDFRDAYKLAVEIAG